MSFVQNSWELVWRRGEEKIKLAYLLERAVIVFFTGEVGNHWQGIFSRTVIFALKFMNPNAVFSLSKFFKMFLLLSLMKPVFS